MDLGLFASLPDRDLRREGLLIGEGRLVAERVAARCRLRAVLAEPSAAAEAERLAAGSCPVAVLDAAQIQTIAGYPFHRGILVAAERPPRVALEAALSADSAGRAGRRALARLVVLPNPADPENLGAIARSAAALGWDALVLGPEACDPWGRRALRCSMAATLALPIYDATDAGALDLLGAAAWTTVAASEAGAGEPGTLGTAEKLALVLGNERSGIPADWLARCATTVAIPQGRTAADGVDSLNVAAAAAILLWEGRVREAGACRR